MDAAKVSEARRDQEPSLHSSTDNDLKEDFKGTEYVKKDDPERGSAEEEKPAAPPAGPPPGMRPEDFPEGGRGWLVVFGGWCALFCSFGLVNCIGVFQEYYENGPLHNYSGSTISWITSMQVFIMIFFTTVFGRLQDNFGPRWLIIGGSITEVFGLMMLSLSHKYYSFFLTQAIVMALGASAVFNSAVSTVPTWFLRRRATAMGIMVSGSSLGGVIMPIMIYKLLPRLGFGWTVRVIAFMILGLLTIASATLRSRLPPRPRPFVLKDYFDTFRDFTFMLTTLGALMFGFGMYLPFNYVLVQAQAAGISPKLVPYLLPILNAVSIFGRVLPGIWADKFGRFNTIIAITFISALITLAVWIPVKSTAGLLVFVIIYGFSSGGFISLGPACIAQISELPKLGTRIGASFAIQAFGALFGAPIGGAIVTRQHGKYIGLQLFCGLTMVVGCLFFVWARHVQVGVKWKKV